MADSKKRIKLAEAMFPEWTISSNIHGDLIMWHGKDREGKSIQPVPDPENDANDDYAVLEWMRIEHPSDSWREIDELACCSYYYKIGDYARAALKVICEHSKSARGGRLHAICKKCGEHITAYSR